LQKERHVVLIGPMTVMFSIDMKPDMIDTHFSIFTHPFFSLANVHKHVEGVSFLISQQARVLKFHCHVKEISSWYQGT